MLPYELPFSHVVAFFLTPSRQLLEQRFFWEDVLENNSQNEINRQPEYFPANRKRNYDLPPKSNISPRRVSHQ
ncbi:MAG: hypothetical protein AABW79_00535 [Nanoarchaeota archaeon]